MQIFKRLWARIDKTRLLLAVILPGLIIYSLVKFEDFFLRSDSVFSFLAVLTLVEHWYLTYFFGLEWTLVSTGGFVPLDVSPPVLLVVLVLNYAILIGLFYIGLRIHARIRGRASG